MKSIALALTAQPETFSMRHARRHYADRECVTPAAYKPVDTNGERQLVLDTPRERRRRYRPVSFRAWVRTAYRHEPALSPKLSRIVHGKDQP
jgi:hypothetical protein